MIVADRKVLTASLAQKSLQIQSQLVFLYTNNLNAISTQAALFSAFAFTGLEETDYPETGFGRNNVLPFFYYFFITICFLTAMSTLLQSTIETIWGPSMAMNGENHEAVIDAAEHMKLQQRFVFKTGVCFLMLDFRR